MRGRKYKLSDAGSDSEILQTLCEEGEEKEVFFSKYFNLSNAEARTQRLVETI